MPHELGSLMFGHYISPCQEYNIGFGETHVLCGEGYDDGIGCGYGSSGHFSDGIGWGCGNADGSCEIQVIKQYEENKDARNK